MTPADHSGAAPGFGRRPLGTGSLTLSIGVHVVAVIVMFWVIPTLQPDPLYYKVVELEFVSAPPPQAPPPEEPEPPAPEDDLVVETPDEPEPPEPEVEEEDPVPVLEEDPEPEPEPEPDSTETLEPQPDESPPVEDIPVPAEPDEEDEDEGVAEIQVRQEGFKADYPDYYARMLAQVNRCLQRTSQGRMAQNLVATVRFVVERDGNTADFGVVHTSGRTAFDTDVLTAIECAGMAGRLGPLPEDYPYEVLPITLVVSPRGGGFVEPPTGDER
ncbi:MAG: TonB C-terminal domain-containing protein [Gemmatimonadetes bacterium]|nr:TonB C-terminal domain-containing protein [Gemmatimonadota bacterium]